MEVIGKSLLKKHNPEEVRSRLSEQLQALAARRDVVRLSEFREFLHVHTSATQLDSYLTIEDQPVGPLWTMDCGKVAVIDFHYDVKDDALLTLEREVTVKEKRKNVGVVQLRPSSAACSRASKASAFQAS